jgi:hypothetical protein
MVTDVTLANCSPLQSAGRRERQRSPMSAAKFREYAAEHMEWARTATSDRERQTFEQMAEVWLEAAAVWESLSNAEDGST